MPRVDELTFVPKFVGQPMYRMGLPVPNKNISIEGRSIEDLYIAKYGDAGENLTEMEERALKEWVVYYVNAPFYWPYSAELVGLFNALDLDNHTLEDFIDKCLEHGLDPF